jgi:pimeloyl-ACP methyl ester carboxylesterase
MSSQRSSAAEAAPRTIVVVHGLWMVGAVFALQRAQLTRSGYRTVAFSYPSTRLAIDEIAARLVRFVAGLGERVHLVGHSLGGLVILDMLALYPNVPVGRVVLLGTPCTGSSVARHVARSGAGRALVGRALLDWQPERGAVAASRCEIGMIAGTVRFGVGSFLVPLPRPNDGVVALEETRMPGLRDHLALGLSHSALLVSSRASRQICHFLEHGCFARP